MCPNYYTTNVGKHIIATTRDNNKLFALDILMHEYLLFEIIIANLGGQDFSK